MTDELMTCAEVAKLFRVSEKTLSDWRQDGNGNGPDWITIGPRRVVYRASVVQAWLETQEALSRRSA